jgi:hypothetical protein
MTGKQAENLSYDELKNHPLVKEKMEEGINQVKDYSAKLEEKYKDLRLQKFVITSIGFERVCYEKVGDAHPL